MVEKLNKYIHSRTFIIISILILICLTLLVGTYAWFTWSSTDNTSLTMTIGRGADVVFTSGNQIDAELSPVFNYTDGLSTTFSIRNKDTSGATIGYSVKFNITTIAPELISEDVKWVLVKNNVIVAQDNLSAASDGISIKLYGDTLSSGTTSFAFYLYIDGNVQNSSSMMGKSIVGNIMVYAEEIGTLAEYITKLYTSADKTVVTNNSKEYNYATSVNLMNDRLGGTTSSLDGGNIRYYGASPNNYIDIGDIYEEDVVVGNWEAYGLEDLFTESSECYAYFECSNLVSEGLFEDEASCTAGLPGILEQELGVSSVDDVCDTTIAVPKGTPILYRIIGLFKDIQLADGSKQDLIKVVREESIGNYSWDTSDSAVNDGYGINEWGQADLMKLLNPGYESETVGGSLWWNSGTGTCYYGDSNATTSCDFTGKGLSSNVQNKIASVVWNTGGWNSSSVYSNQIYAYERGTNVISNPSDGVTRTTTWTGKVALMYPSDYGYATDFNNCGNTLNNYNTDSCYNNDWLYSSSNQWLLTPNNNIECTSLMHSRAVEYNYTVSNVHAVKPVFYLNSKLGIVSGDGLESNPYVVR